MRSLVISRCSYETFIYEGIIHEGITGECCLMPIMRGTRLLRPPSTRESMIQYG
jgi:hypothetical protein